MDKETKRTAIQIATLSGVGIAMAVAIFGCFFLGRWLDRQLSTEPYLAFLFLLIGIAAGFRNIYVLIKRYVRNEGSQVESERQRKRPPAKKT